MTNEQLQSLARLMRDRPQGLVTILRAPYDLPEGYVEVNFATNGYPSFVCGIAPDGRVSS